MRRILLSALFRLASIHNDVDKGQEQRRRYLLAATLRRDVGSLCRTDSRGGRRRDKAGEKHYLVAPHSRALEVPHWAAGTITGIVMGSPVVASITDA